MFNLVAAQESVTPQCKDGIDNDRDGDIDFPKDDSCRRWARGCSAFAGTSRSPWLPRPAEAEG